MLALKTDAGSGALEQMVLAEYCAPHFESHVPRLARGLRATPHRLLRHGGGHLGMRVAGKHVALAQAQAQIIAGVLRGSARMQ